MQYEITSKLNAEGVIEYGIKASDNSVSIQNISTNKHSIEVLTDKFNSNNLSKEHLSEAIDDFINSL